MKINSKTLGKILLFAGIIGLILVSPFASSMAVFVLSGGFVILGAIIMIATADMRTSVKAGFFLMLFLIIGFSAVVVYQRVMYWRSDSDTVTLGGISLGSSAEAETRDFHRSGDSEGFYKTAQKYYEENGTYPVGQDVVVGEGQGKFFSYKTGFASQRPTGETYTIFDKNPVPGGIDYLYNSLHKDGSVCVAEPCDWYEMHFDMETNAMMNRPTFPLGKGEHVVTPDGID